MDMRLSLQGRDRHRIRADRRRRRARPGGDFDDWRPLRRPSPKPSGRKKAWQPFPKRSRKVSSTFFDSAVSAPPSSRTWSANSDPSGHRSRHGAIASTFSRWIGVGPRRIHSNVEGLTPNRRKPATRPRCSLGRFRFRLFPNP